MFVTGLIQNRIENVGDIGFAITQGDPIEQHLPHLHEGIERPPFERMIPSWIGGEVHEGDGRLPAVLPRPAAQCRLRLRAQRPFGGVDDAVKAHAIGRVMHHAQIGDDVLHFAPLVKFGRADESIRHTGHHQRLFQRTRLGVGAVHNRHIVERVLPQQRLHRHRDHRRLFALVIRFADDDGCAAAPVGEQIFVNAIRIVGNDRLRRVQNKLGGAVILLQQHHLRRWVLFTEPVDVAVIRAAPTIDGLVAVADDKDVAMPFCQQIEQRVLRHVGVLELIDKDVLIPLLIRRQHVGTFLQKQDGVHQQIVKIHPVVEA